MNIISVISDKNGNFSQKIGVFLEKYGGAVLITSKKLVNLSAGKPSFLVVSLNCPEIYETESSVIIFQEKPGGDFLNSFSEKNTAIFVETEKAEYFENEISLGHSGDSDIIIASCGDGSAVLAVSRPILTLKKNSLLPCEIKTVFGEKTADVKAAAALCAALIYFNIIDEGTSELKI